MAQIRGAFPYPYAQPAEGGGVITLAGGGVFYFPSGEYIISLPAANMSLEWWNPLANSWVTVTAASDYISADGFNLRLRNLTSGISLASFTAGSGGVNGIGFAATGAKSVVAPLTAGGITATAYAIVAPRQRLRPSRRQDPASDAPLVVIDALRLAAFSNRCCGADSGRRHCSSPWSTSARAIRHRRPHLIRSPPITRAPWAASLRPRPASRSGLRPTPFPATRIHGHRRAVDIDRADWIRTSTGVVIINPAPATAIAPATVTGVGAATATLNTVTAAANAVAFVQPRVQ
jgi:hypothetical protein